MKNRTNTDNSRRLTNHIGFEAEQSAKRFLISQGLQFVENNYTVPLGEIDLIFKDQNQFVFIEVKYRKDSEHGCAAEQFTPRKRAKMQKAILCYLQEHNMNVHHTQLRLDLIAIDNNQLEWIKNI